MEYKTKSGYTITDEDIEKIGQAIERGEYPGRPGKIIVAPPGRPPICPGGDLVTVAFKVPKSYRDKLDKQAKRRNKTRSEFMREVLEKAITAS
jgi:Arc/MetJ-type ribon-helix-helix transcriptional regulator